MSIPNILKNKQGSKQTNQVNKPIEALHEHAARSYLLPHEVLNTIPFDKSWHGLRRTTGIAEGSGLKLVARNGIPSAPCRPPEW